MHEVTRGPEIACKSRNRLKTPANESLWCVKSKSANLSVIYSRRYPPRYPRTPSFYHLFSMNSRGWWLSSNSICLLSILHEFAWTMATLKQYFFIIYSPRIHMDDSYPRTASFYYLFSTNSCGRWLLSNNIFLLSILHEFMWSSRTASFYYLFSMNSCGRWLLSNSIFLSSILHEFMWTIATLK